MLDENSSLPRTVAYGIIATGFLIILVLTFQLSAGFLTFDYYPAALLFGYISNLVVLPILLIAATKARQLLLPALLWLHFSMGVMILYFSQIYSPFTVTWATLILLSSIYYRWKGFWLSSAALCVFAFLYIVMFPENLVSNGGTVTYSFLSALVVALTVLTSYMFVMIIVSSQRKNRALMKSQESEFLQVTRLNTLLNSISDAVLTLNRYGRITSQNAAAQGFFDTNQSLIGRDIDKLLILTNDENESVSIRALIDEVKSSSLRDDLSVGSGGDVRHLSVQMARIRSTFGDSEEYGVVLIIRDITKQKTLEEEKDEFISVTSHELRTPIAIAEGSLSNFLLMQERGASKEKLASVAEEAHKQVVYLAKMINDLSTLSRAERGVGSDVEPIKVNEMLHNLYLKYEPEATEKSLHLNLEAEHHLPNVETSRLYLEEILQNFITNAIKYTKEGSVTFGAKMESEGTIRFFVRDTGIGIGKADVQHIFEKFYRSEDYRTRETSGTGLGLYVVEKLASKLGTKIDVESRFNVGSTFSFVMQARAAAVVAVENASVVPDAGAIVADTAAVDVPEPEEKPAEESTSEVEPQPVTSEETSIEDEIQEPVEAADTSDDIAEPETSETTEEVLEEDESTAEEAEKNTENVQSEDVAEDIDESTKDSGDASEKTEETSETDETGPETEETPEEHQDDDPVEEDKPQQKEKPKSKSKSKASKKPSVS